MQTGHLDIHSVPKKYPIGFYSISQLTYIHYSMAVVKKPPFYSDQVCWSVLVVFYQKRSFLEFLKYEVTLELTNSIFIS